MIPHFPFIAQRLFNAPLAVHPAKAEIIMAALADRLGIASVNGIKVGAMFDSGDDYGFAEQKESPAHAYENINGVAVIPVQGTLVQKLGTLRPYSGMSGYDGIRQNFMVAISDPDVDAIMLDIDSPGGEAAGCFDLVDAIYEARGEKPIWAILNENAFSAAYAIASATDRIVVPRTGSVGSIGVVAMHVDWSKALTAAGINVTFIYYGDRKIDGHAEIPLSDEARASFQSDIDTMGELFVNTVSRNRGMTFENVRKTQAAGFLGVAGVNVGLADEVMAPDAAFRALLKTVKEM